MKTSKITEIVSVEEREWQYWKMYWHKLKLENWETIKLNKKKPDSFKVWESVSYEENWEWKWKQIIEEQPKQQQKKFNPEANNRWAMVGMSYRLAFELVYKWEDDFQKAVALAQRIFEEAMQTYNHQSDWEKPLPF